MDFLSRTYAATLLEQSRFYFPPLGGMRSAQQEPRPPASPASFLELGLPARGPRERERPLDLSTKTIRQGSEAADGDVMVLDHRRSRNHLQLAAALAAGKLPFAFGGQGPFIAGPHLSLFPHDGLQATAATPGGYRGGDGSAFLTPPSNLHSAICGGLNGFCLDPHRCRFASLSMAAAAAAASRHPSEAFQGTPPYAAMYERHLAKLVPAAYADLLPPASSSSAAPPPPPSTSTTPSGDLLKQHQHYASGDAYLQPFPLAAALGMPTYHAPHSKEAPPTSCSAFLPNPYQLPCACCYPPATAAPPPPRGFDAGGMFASPAALLSRDFAQDAKDKVKREAVTPPHGGARAHQTNGKHQCKNPAAKMASPPAKLASVQPPTSAAQKYKGQDGHRSASPVKPQAEGGRWIPHPHSHHKAPPPPCSEAPPVIKSEVLAPTAPAPSPPPTKHSVSTSAETPTKGPSRVDGAVDPDSCKAEVAQKPQSAIDRWMLSVPPDADGEARSLQQSWNPPEVKREFNVVAPVVARVSELPASPAEGCAPVSVEARGDVTSGAFLTESPVQGIKEDEQRWKTPIKRAFPEAGPVPAKKMRKKDVIVISMRDDHHQGHHASQVLMKSVKRKLTNDLANGYTSPLVDDRFSTDPAVAAALLGLASPRHGHHFHHQRPLPHLQQPQKSTEDEPEKKRASISPPSGAAPPVGVTLVKTGHPGPAQYKSSVLNVNAVHHKSTEDTTAMLRLYYEQQKQRLQEGYQKVLSSESPHREAHTPTTAALTSSAVAVAPCGHRQRAQTPHGSSVLSAPQRKFRKQEEEEARDGDDEREDDAEENPTREPRDDGQEVMGRQGKGLEVTMKTEERRGTNENIENEKNANNHIQSSVPEPVIPATPSTPATPIASRAESTKRLMINKALGETTLHRAARLGYLDVLSICLETQSIDINARDNAGYTPLHECCSRGHLEIARQLLQYGADPNASAAGGIRPIHDAIEYDRLEIVRLLLSYGADPVIATYSGLTPVKLARSPIMQEFLKGYLADINGESDSPVMPWQFHGSASFFDPWPTGYDPFMDLPSEDEGNEVLGGDVGDDDDVDNGAALIFEVSDKPHIPTYRVPASRRNGSGVLRFCLLQDVLHQTAMDRDAFLSCYPDIQVATMPRQEFVTRAKCTQLMVDVSAALEACPASPWVEYVHWDDTIRDILDIERVSIPRLDD